MGCFDIRTHSECIQIKETNIFLSYTVDFCECKNVGLFQVSRYWIHDIAVLTGILVPHDLDSGPVPLLHLNFLFLSLLPNYFSSFFCIVDIFQTHSFKFFFLTKFSVFIFLKEFTLSIRFHYDVFRQGVFLWLSFS